MTLKDTSETRSFIDPRTLRHWCPYMFLQSAHTYINDDIDITTSPEKLSLASFGFTALAQTIKKTSKVGRHFISITFAPFIIIIYLHLLH